MLLASFSTHTAQANQDDAIVRSLRDQLHRTEQVATPSSLAEGDVGGSGVCR